ncbi:MAG: RsmB/NOP family class I SAM-dependent RNA methyltransferase [Lachnospiraceae bacterium]|nr:RsmB/NOP family class I SAM-dependent RNA methyltransferase [Lachnospiraceae bacterium]
MLPELFLKRMEGMLGEEYEEFVKSLEKERYQALRRNPLKKHGAGEPVLPFHLTPVPWAANGYYYEKEDQPGRHPYHDAGVYYIQEPSAMAPVPMLRVRPGEKILDLCAAPGGKSTQIAADMKGQGLLIANEIHPARAKILSENIERMGVVNACVTNETPARLAESFPEYFDRILVDAPCSGEGMFRKNENACEEWSPENVEFCAARQDEILSCAAKMLVPGGRIVYSTCTFAPQEDEGSVERFLERHPEFTQREAKRLWPHKVKGEGHFAAVLEKAGQLCQGYDREALCGTEKGMLEKQPAEYLDFVKETLQAGVPEELLPGGRYLMFGDHLYLIPKEMPALRGLKVLRPGLQIGTLKKNRFEPAHALALALAPSQVKHVWELDSAGAAVRAYLNGQTFPAEGEKGWYLICVDGFGLGWGKLAGGIMKNHYPKGLRINP